MAYGCPTKTSQITVVAAKIIIFILCIFIYDNILIKIENRALEVDFFSSIRGCFKALFIEL